jgi:hypothetical protein
MVGYTSDLQTKASEIKKHVAVCQTQSILQVGVMSEIEVCLVVKIA